MKAVVLCAGLGSRLGNLTKTVPKPMLPLNGKPLLLYTLHYLKKYGIREIAVNLHYMHEKIMRYFNDGHSYGVQIHYSHEEKLLGTAGALVRLIPWLWDEEAFIVLYGDILTDQNILLLVEKHLKENSLATLLLHKRKESNSIVKIDQSGRITCFKERPSEEEKRRLMEDNDEVWVNSGIQVLSKKALRYIAEIGAFDLPRDVYCKYFKRGEIFGVPLTGFRIAIDSPDRYYAAEQAIKRKDYSSSLN